MEADKYTVEVEYLLLSKDNSNVGGLTFTLLPLVLKFVGLILSSWQAGLIIH